VTSGAICVLQDYLQLCFTHQGWADSIA
jgi:hypothetical protein